MSKQFSLARMSPLEPPRVDRGQLLFVEDVAVLLRGKRSEWWIRKNVAPEKRIKLGRVVAWYESDVRDWLYALADGSGS